MDETPLPSTLTARQHDALVSAGIASGDELLQWSATQLVELMRSQDDKLRPGPTKARQWITEVATGLVTQETERLDPAVLDGWDTEASFTVYFLERDDEHGPTTQVMAVHNENESAEHVWPDRDCTELCAWMHAQLDETGPEGASAASSPTIDMSALGATSGPPVADVSALGATAGPPTPAEDTEPAPLASGNREISALGATSGPPTTADDSGAMTERSALGATTGSVATAEQEGRDHAPVTVVAAEAALSSGAREDLLRRPSAMKPMLAPGWRLRLVLDVGEAQPITAILRARDVATDDVIPYELTELSASAGRVVLQSTRIALPHGYAQLDVDITDLETNRPLAIVPLNAVLNTE